MEKQQSLSSHAQNHRATSTCAISSASPFKIKDRDVNAHDNSIVDPIESGSTRKRKRKRNSKPSEQNATSNTILLSKTKTTKSSINDDLLHPNFTELGKLYPSFKLAWNNLKERREQKQSGSTGKKHRDDSRDKRRHECFSTNVDFDFNLALSRALLDKHFHLALPLMPRGNLCPPIPNRFHYVLWIKELIQQCHHHHASNNEVFFEDKEEDGNKNTLHRRGMDLGIGASAIYPLLLSSKSFTNSGNDDDESNNSWIFFGTDVDPYSIQCAQQNINANNLEDKIKVSLVSQSSPLPPIHRSNESTPDDRSYTNRLYQPCGPIQKAMQAARSTMMQTTLNIDGEKIGMSKSLPHNPNRNEDGRNKKAMTKDWVCFDFCMTNPPFYSTIEQATTPRYGDARSRTDMTSQEGVYPNGGEIGFVKDMIHDSFFFQDCITWFTSMVGRKSSLLAINAELKNLGFGRGSIRTTEFVQGKITRWGIAWTFQKVSIRSEATKLSGGLTSFEVEFHDSPSPPEVHAEVSRRISSFCETFKDAKICSQKVDDETIAIKDDTLRCDHVNEGLLDACLPEVQILNNKTRQFLVDIKLGLIGRIQTNENMKVCVNLTLFAHSNKGMGIARKIQSQVCFA